MFTLWQAGTLTPVGPPRPNKKTGQSGAMCSFFLLSLSLSIDLTDPDDGKENLLLISSEFNNLSLSLLLPPSQVSIDDATAAV